MIQTRNILDFSELFEKDFPAVKALWGELHAQATENNCWPGTPSDKVLARLRKNYDWAVVEVKGHFGFTFWKLDPDGNAYVQAIAALTEAPYLHLVIASVSASQTEAYGMLARNRPERTWFQNIGATFEPCGYAPMTPAEESRHATRVEKLLARVPVQDKVIVPVSLLPAIRARLEAL